MIGTGFAVTAITNLQQSTLTASFSSDVLIISNAVPSDVAAGSTISFSVTQFLNPISTAYTSGFSAQTTDSSDGGIDSLTTTLRVTTPAAVYSSTIAAKDTTVVQEKAVLRLQFYIPVPLNSGWVVDIQYPSDFTLSGADLTTVIGYGLFGGARTLTGSLNTGNNTYTITDGWSTYVSQNIIAILDFNSIANPFSVKTTSSISIYVKDSSLFPIAQLITGITYTATTGTLTGISLTPDSTIVSSVTSATIKFLPAHKLKASTSQLLVTLPSDVSLADQSSTSTWSISQLQNISPTVTWTAISNVITIINPFSVDYTPVSGSPIAFKIGGFTMPASLKPPGAISVVTKITISSTLYNVDSASATGVFVATVGSILTSSISPTSLVTYTSTTYTITFKAQNTILQNGYVTITFPSEVSIPNTSTSASSWLNISGFLTSISWSITGSIVKVTNGFTSGSVVGGTSISFSINGILNPVSMATTNSFSIITYDSSDFQIDSKSSGITLTMTSSSLFTSVSLSIGSNTNGATNTYTFTMTASAPISKDNYIYMKIPNTVTPPSTPVCKGTIQLSSTLTCETLNTDIYVTVAFSGATTSINAGVQFAFTINGFINPTSTLPSNAITYFAYDSAYNEINKYPTGTIVTTTTAATITTASISNDNQYASQSAVFTLTIKTVNEIPVNGIIIITYPSQVQPYDSSVTTITWSVSIAISPVCSHNSASRTITITNIVPSTKLIAGTSIQITLSNMKNPSTSTASSSFIVSTYQVSSGNNYIIDSVSTGLTVKSNWNYPCKECSSSTPSVCTSCLKDSSGNQLLLQTSTVSGSTVTTWVTAWNEDYANVNNVCQPCLANWGAWLSTDLSSWTKWGKTAAQFLVGTRCTNTCPDGTYGNTSNNKWDSWVYPWDTWDGASSCKSWAKLDGSGNTSTLIKLQGNQCLSSCTSNTYVDVNNIWTLWSSNCKYWSSKITVWTACNSPLILNSLDNTWISTCPSGTTVYNSGTNTWDAWSTNWATWSGSTSTWATWVSGLVLTTSNTCATNCLTTHEYINTSSKWVNCATGWTSCSGSSSYWDKWNTGYLFANFTWTTSWPSGFSLDLSNSSKWVLTGLQWAFGYQIDASGTKWEPSSIACNSGYTLNSDKTKCIPEPGAIAPFPFLIIYFVFVIVIVIGYIINRNEMITTWLIKGIAIIEMPYYIVQIFSAAYISSWGIMAGTVIALAILIWCNIAFYIVYNVNVINDNAFKHWKDKYKCQSYTITILQFIILWNN